MSILIGLVFALVAFAATRRVISTAVVFFAAWFISYGTMPVLAWGYVGLVGILFLTVIIVGVGEVGISDILRQKFRKGGVFSLSGVLVLFGVVMTLTSAGCLNSGAYRALIGDVEEQTFSTDLPPVDPANVRIIDEDVARRLGEKRLGENTALGSQVVLGKMNIQLVNGQLYWVGFLDHSGFFKWLNNEGTPGYIMVSATDERDVRLVQETSGSPLNIKYNMGAWFGDQPHRYLYNNGYSTVGLTDFTYEIDDQGRPYLVVSRYENRIGFGGSDVTGVVVLDVQTGEVQEYGIEDTPAWVDRIQPEYIVVSQLNDWGEYVHGWPNFSSRDKLKTTEGMSLVYGADGRAYWYTGITSVGADEGTVGFVLVDTRTKRTTFYKQAGATETDAKRSAEGSVQEKGYLASFPVMYSVGGQPTYFMPLKDGAGLVKQVAFVSVENYQVVGIGDDVEGALRRYRRELASRGNAVALENLVERFSAEGRVLRLTPEVKGSMTYYYLLLEGFTDKAFVGTSDISVELPYTREGDVVKVVFEDGGNAVVDIYGFDNVALEFQTTAEQQEVDSRFARVDAELRSDRATQNAEADWENLSPEEKAALMKRAKEEQ